MPIERRAECNCAGSAGAEVSGQETKKSRPFQSKRTSRQFRLFAAQRGIRCRKGGRRRTIPPAEYCPLFYCEQSLRFGCLSGTRRARRTRQNELLLPRCLVQTLGCAHFLSRQQSDFGIPKSRLSCLESGGREGIRTPGLLVANGGENKLRQGATIT